VRTAFVRVGRARFLHTARAHVRASRASSSTSLSVRGEPVNAPICVPAFPSVRGGDLPANATGSTGAGGALRARASPSLASSLPGRSPNKHVAAANQSHPVGQCARSAFIDVRTGAMKVWRPHRKYFGGNVRLFPSSARRRFIARSTPSPTRMIVASSIASPWICKHAIAVRATASGR